MDYVKYIARESEPQRLSKTLHASENDVTLCGKSLNERWFVLGQCYDSDVDCPTCRRQLLLREPKR